MAHQTFRHVPESPNNFFATVPKHAQVEHVKPHTQAIDFTTPFVMVKVGHPSKSFFVQGPILQVSSGFFQSALKKEWREGQERVVELPEDKPGAFNLYVDWLHSRQLPVFLATGENFRDSSAWQRLIDAYILGDKLLDSDFKDAVTDVTVLANNTPLDGRAVFPSPAMRKMLFDKTPPNSTARRLLVHTMARTMNSLANVADSPEFLVEVIKEQINRNCETTNDAATRCEFHEHGDNECYRKKHGLKVSFP